jgi:hypothetical protein
MLMLLLLACDPAITATDLCRERRDALDALYARYGGSAVAAEAQKGVLGGVIGEADRTRFEAGCVELGGGGRPTFMAKKAKDFFAEPQTKKTCERVVDLALKLKAANRELPADAQVACP